LLHFLLTLTLTLTLTLSRRQFQPPRLLHPPLILNLLNLICRRCPTIWPRVTA
jgi:hypothetical protein